MNKVIFLGIVLNLLVACSNEDLVFRDYAIHPRTDGKSLKPPSISLQSTLKF